MKRRNFITASLLAMPALSFANKLSGGKKQPVVNPVKGFIVRADESRYSGEQSKAGDAFLQCKISTADSGEQLFIQASTPKVFKEKGGPPPHVHGLEDEIIYIVSGQFIVHIDGTDHKVKAGDTAFIPRGTLHTVINPKKNNKGTLLTIFQPAPKKVEDFFKHISIHGDIAPELAPDGWQ